MPYFTSWDANLYLCLMSLGLHHDISLSLTRRIKKVHRDYCLEEARSYYLDRSEWMMYEWMLTGRGNERRIVYNHKEFNMRAIVDIACIPYFFWSELLRMNFEYEDTIRKIEPEERNDYFEWAYENHYHRWDIGMLDWVKGFHPGRWILMDMKRDISLEDTRGRLGAYSEERFILGKDHIDDLIAGRLLYNI